MLGPPAHLCGLDQNRQWLCTRRRGLGRGLISDNANEGRARACFEVCPTPLETRRTVCLDSFWHIACVLFGLWSVRFPLVLVRTGRRLPVQALGERRVLVSVTGYPRGGAPGPGRNFVTRATRNQREIWYMESGPSRVNAPLEGPVIPRSRRDLFKDQSFADSYNAYTRQTGAVRWGAACKGKVGREGGAHREWYSVGGRGDGERLWVSAWCLRKVQV